MHDDHIVWCVHHDGPNEVKNLKVLDTLSYSEKELKLVLIELTLTELAEIQPKISVVKHKMISQ